MVNQWLWDMAVAMAEAGGYLTACSLSISPGGLCVLEAAGGRCQIVAAAAIWRCCCHCSAIVCRHRQHTATTQHSHLDGLVQERRNSSALAMELCLSCTKPSTQHWYFDGLVQQRRNSSTLAMELCLSCTNPSTQHWHFDGLVQERCNSSTLAMKLRLSYTKPSIWKSEAPETGIKGMHK